MRLLVCGGREFGLDYDRRGTHRPQAAMERNGLRELLDEWHSRRPITHVIQGGARGADALAGAWARQWTVPCAVFSISQDRWDAWMQAGRPSPSPGHERNAQMLLEGGPDAVLAFPGGTGTEDMVRQAVEAGCPTARAVFADGRWEVRREREAASTLKINGRDFRCECGRNVFRPIWRKGGLAQSTGLQPDEKCYACNGCSLRYAGSL